MNFIHIEVICCDLNLLVSLIRLFIVQIGLFILLVFYIIKWLLQSLNLEESDLNTLGF